MDVVRLRVDLPLLAIVATAAWIVVACGGSDSVSPKSGCISPFEVGTCGPGNIGQACPMEGCPAYECTCTMTGWSCSTGCELCVDTDFCCRGCADAAAPPDADADADADGGLDSGADVVGDADAPSDVVSDVATE